MMRVVRENSTLLFVNIEGNDCAAGVSAIHTLHDLHIIDVIATHRRGLKPGCADSESHFLAMKKFSLLPASRLIAARQNRFFARIASTDSQAAPSRRSDKPSFVRHPEVRLRVLIDVALRRRRALLRCQVWT
jgi:hypothetical protein